MLFSCVDGLDTDQFDDDGHLSKFNWFLLGVQDLGDLQVHQHPQAGAQPMALDRLEHLGCTA